MQLCKISSSEWLRQDFQVIHCPNGMQMILPRRRSSPDLQVGKCQAKWQDRCYILWVDPMIFSRDLFGRPIKRNVPMIILLIVGKDTNQENLRHKGKKNYQIYLSSSYWSHRESRFFQAFLQTCADWCHYQCLDLVYRRNFPADALLLFIRMIIEE